jgi:nitrate reductase gamma subunit
MEDRFLEFVKLDLQIIALSLFGLLYAFKVYQLLKLPWPKEVAPQRGHEELGVLYSFAWLVSPWSMSSTTQHIGRWVEFAVYHLGAGAAILGTFSIPFWPAIMTRPVSLTMAALVIGAFVVGIIKLWRRITAPELRVISTPDDYFSLAAVQVFFFFTAMALITEARGWMIAYFLITAAFLIYVPFSKISHYVYWFFARVFFGIRYGRRGIITGKRA